MKKDREKMKASSEKSEQDDGRLQAWLRWREEAEEARLGSQERLELLLQLLQGRRAEETALMEKRWLIVRAAGEEAVKDQSQPTEASASYWMMIKRLVAMEKAVKKEVKK